MARTVCALLAVALCSRSSPGAEADALLDQGAQLLHKAIGGDDSALVPAANALTRASALYEKRGDDEGGRRANALLYWCKKRMTLADVEAFNRDADSALTKKLDDISKPVAHSRAEDYYRRAEEFARENPTDHLLIAVRFFEVADRFAQTPTGVEAMRRSLSAMQKVRMDPGVTAPPPGGGAGRTPVPTAVEKTEGDWRPFTNGVNCHKGGKEYVLEVPEQLAGTYFLEVGRGRLDVRANADVTLHAFSDHAVNRLQAMGFRPAPGVQAVWKGAFGKRRTSQVYMKECRRGDAVVERESWVMLMVNRDAVREARAGTADTAPPTDEAGPASYPDVTAIKDRHAASLEKARATYLKKLESACEGARRRGKLEVVDAIGAEMRMVRDPDASAGANDLGSSSLRYAQKAYRKARYKALAAYVKELDRLASSETRKGDLEKARHCLGLSSEARRALVPMTILKEEGEWYVFSEGANCISGGEVFVLEAPERLQGKPYLQVGKGRLNIRMTEDVTLYAFGHKAAKRLRSLRFQPAPGLQVAWRGTSGKRETAQVYVKRCRRGEAVVVPRYWAVVIAE